MDDVNYFINVYSFSLSYLVTCTVDDCAFRINFPSGIRNKCILFKRIEIIVSLSCGCVIYFTSNTYNYSKMKCKYAH